MAFIEFEFLSHSLMRTVPVTAVLPVDYTSFSGSKIPPAKPPYKTLYLLHGIFNNHRDWVLRTNIERLAREQGIAIIMPAGENNFYVDNQASPISHGQYIGKELVEVTRRMFCLSDKREDTFIGGYSMGGYGAIMNGLRYSETFSHIISLSPSIASKKLMKTIFQEIPFDESKFIHSVFGDCDLDKDENYNPMAFVDSLLSQGAELPEIYITVGSEDKLVIDGCRDFEFHLRNKGIPFVYEESDGGHDYTFWSEAIKKGLKWLPAGEMLTR